MPVLLSALWMGFGVAVGILSGFLGVGGGVVLTPLLLYLGYSPKVATATALAFVIPTAWASIMKGREYVDVTLAVLLAVGAVVGAYAIGQPLVQSPHLDPRLYKKLFGLLLLVVGFDMVSGFTDALRQRQEHRAAWVSQPYHGHPVMAAPGAGGTGGEAVREYVTFPGDVPGSSTKSLLSPPG